MDVQEFLHAFENVKQRGDHYTARCGAHEDAVNSLAIKERDGKILVHCFAGCTPEAVLTAAGYNWADVFTSNGHNPRFQIRDYSGQLRAIHARRDSGKSKSFSWFDADGKSGLNGVSPSDLPLYGADRVTGWDMDKPVVVAEGEKAALALMAAGLQAVGTVCGASSLPSDDVLAVLTANDVVLWPDNDEAGQRHMRLIGAKLRQIAARVRIVRWPDAPAKADAADIGDPGTIRKLVELAIDMPSPLSTLSAYSTDAPPPMLIGRLDPSGHTIIYGAGGVGKGTYVSWLLSLLVRDGHRPLVLDYEHHPEEWARRVYGLSGSEALNTVRYAAPLSAAWQGKRGPLWEAADELRALCIDEGITVVIVDSLAIACAGADVSDPGTPALYAAGLELLERPVLSLAHVNRAHDMTYPFGSAFWHNLARMTWSLEEDGPITILSPRKANNYIKTPKQAIEITWSDGLPRSIFERPYGDTIADRAFDALAGERLSTKELADALNEARDEGMKIVKPDSLRDALTRLTSRGMIGKEGPRGKYKWFRVLQGGKDD